VYARYGITENTADITGFVLDNRNEFQAGGDMNWRDLRLAATYSDRESSLYNYQSMTVSENYSLFATRHHDAALNFSQQWNNYGDQQSLTSQIHETEYYSFTGQYGWHPASSFSLNCQAGYQQQLGDNTDQNTLVLRTDAVWRVGKLDFRIGYQYENQEYIQETRGRNYVYLNMRRSF
jgi:hypothetical protein